MSHASLVLVALVSTALAAGSAAVAQTAGQDVLAPPAAAANPAAELAPGVTFKVTHLRRLPDKGVMELKFMVANASQADTSLKDLGLAYDHQLKDIPIIDFAGRKQYSVGQAAHCLCSTFREHDGGVVRAGAQREFWAWYGLPPMGARQLAIQVPDQQPIMNVPLM